MLIAVAFLCAFVFLLVAEATASTDKGALLIDIGACLAFSFQVSVSLSPLLGISSSIPVHALVSG
jgi:hypothetical protein